MGRHFVSAALVVLSLLLGAFRLPAAEWNQWRGPERNGYVAGSPALRVALPAEGLRPVWQSEKIPSAWSGGWGSPVAADGRVYLFTHTREKTAEGEAPERKFPWLPTDKRGHMTDEEYQEYEVQRRNEDEMLAKFFNFREVIYCLDDQTGKTVWKNERPSRYTRILHSGSAAVINGRLYVLCPGRVARCVDAESGEDLWETKLPGEFRDEHMMSSFAVADGAAVVLAGYLAGIDAETGDILWTGDEAATQGTHSSPVVWRSGENEYIIANVAGSQTICVEPQSGRELWRVDSEAGLSTPVVVGDRLITYGNSRKKGLRCYAMSPGGAELLWTFQQAADKGSSPVVVDDHVYVQGERRLACVDLATGKGRWTTLLDVDRPQYTSLIAANGKVMYVHGGLLMFAANAEDFSPLITARFDKSGLMAGDEALRKLHGIDKLAGDAEGQQAAEKLYQDKIGRHGPLNCSTSALADGRLFIRFPDHLACYDLRESSGTQVE